MSEERGVHRQALGVSLRTSEAGDESDALPRLTEAVHVVDIPICAGAISAPGVPFHLGRATDDVIT